MPRPPLTITIITLNEEKNILRAIRSVSWADEILIVDSGSTDRTVDLALSEKVSGSLRVLKNAWSGYGQQKNFAQNHAKHDWVLNIDADEEVSTELRAEIEEQLEALENRKLDTQGFYLPRKTFYLGKWIRHGGWYPNYLIRLVNRKHAVWSEPRVHEELQVKGKVVGLQNAILHYAFTSIQDQIMTNLRFSHLGSQELKNVGQQPSLKKLLLKPIGKFFETYLLKAGFLDGLPGFIISINAAHSMFLKYAYLCEDQIRIGIREGENS